MVANIPTFDFEDRIVHFCVPVPMSVHIFLKQRQVFCTKIGGRGN